MTSIFFTKDQNKIFKNQLQDHQEEIKVWQWINIIVPCFIIFIPTMFYSFLPEDRLSFQNLILNGSFSLLGINILFSTSVFLINSIRLKDAKVEHQIIQLRTRLVIFLCVFLIVGAFLYFIQITQNIQTVSQILTVVLGFLMILICSIGFGKKIYLIKDELVGKSYNEAIKDSVSDLKNSVDDLD